MDPANLLLLLGAGLAAGYVAGLVGVGGGIIFAPVLFFYFQRTGIAPDVVTPLTLGSSLFCTFVAALASTWFQYRKGAVVPGVAVRVGLFSALAVFLMTRYVTTQPWYDGTVFQTVFSLLLLFVVARMVLSRPPGPPKDPKATPTGRSTVLATAGTVAGTVATAAGVGGGVVLVPMYHGLLRLSMQRAVATSSATIVLISLVGFASYAVAGWRAAVPPTALGYVDVGQALVLAVPAVLSARLGVWTAHRIDTKALRWSFAAIAAVVAVRLLLRALG